MKVLTKLVVAMLLVLAISIGTSSTLFAQEAETVVEGGGAALAFLSGLLLIVGPTIIGIISVPIFDIIKAVTNLKGKLPAWAQQLMVPLLAYGLTWFSAFASVALPESFELFNVGHVEALLSAAMAFGIKAGQKEKPSL